MADLLFGDFMRRPRTDPGGSEDLLEINLCTYFVSKKKAWREDDHVTKKNMCNLLSFGSI